jgi:hypothetical protein
MKMTDIWPKHFAMLLKKIVVVERELLLFLFNIIHNGMSIIKTTTDEPETAGFTHIKKTILFVNMHSNV